MSDFIQFQPDGWQDRGMLKVDDRTASRPAPLVLRRRNSRRRAAGAAALSVVLAFPVTISTVAISITADRVNAIEVATCGASGAGTIVLPERAPAERVPAGMWDAVGRKIAALSPLPPQGRSKLPDPID